MRACLAIVLSLISASCARVVNDGSDRGRCPSGVFPGSMVSVPSASGSPYCIDSTKVTNAAYEAFLASNLGTSIPRPTSCTTMFPQYAEMLSTLIPEHYWPPADTDGEKPVVGITWCDAWTFCHADG